MRLIIRWLINAIAIVAAAGIIPGITISDGRAWAAVAVAAAVLGLVNATIKPLLSFLACGFVILTLGLGMLVINAFTLWLSSVIAQEWFGVGFHVAGFWPALWGGIIISVVSFVLSMFASDESRSE